MIGQIITDPKTGQVLNSSGNKLSPSSYSPNNEVKKLFAKVQQDYQVAWNLQHRPFEEFDGHSLLERARLDQQTFAAYVGAEYVPAHKKWRWRGRKNTARNKLIGILAHMLAGMLYPFVYAKNEQDEEDKMSARVMRILIQDHLKQAGYEMQFLFMVLSALVNPAIFCGVDYVEAIQLIKKGGKVEEVVDEILSGLNLNIIPIDEMLLGDFYTGPIQRQSYIIRVRRISYDQARSIYKGKYFDENGKDQFDYVQAGMTRIFLAGTDSNTLFDIDWNEADKSFVQELTIQYRGEDLELVWVGGVLMGNTTDPVNNNPFQHRRMVLSKGQWYSVPIYPFAKTYFEPIDPTGRFAYGKSGAFKEFWDDATLNRMVQLAVDGTSLDVIKPMFLSGMGKVDSTVMVPGATVSMPLGAKADAYSLGPNLKAAYDAIEMQRRDMSESTVDPIQNGVPQNGITATATAAAEKNARIFMGVFGLLIADLVQQVGELTMDCIIQYATTGELDTTAPGALGMKFKNFLAKGKDKGKDVTHKIIFSDQYMGRKLTKKQVESIEWGLFDKSGGKDSDQRLYMVNPYQFARMEYSLYVDPDKIVQKSMGTERSEKERAFNIMTDPRVAPYTDQKAVIDDFAIDEYGGDDPDKYKKKGDASPMLGQMFGQATPPTPGSKVPTNPQMMPPQQTQPVV